MVHPHTGRGVREERLEGAGLLPDAQSLSSDGREAAAKPGGRDEMVPGHVHRTDLLPVQAVRTFLIRCGGDGVWERARSGQSY